MYFLLLYCIHCNRRDLKGFWLEACEWQETLPIGSSRNSYKKLGHYFNTVWAYACHMDASPVVGGCGLVSSGSGQRQ